MVQDMHRHDFYYVLVLEKGSGFHEIDFVQHSITDRCVFFMRPGQVHRLRLGIGSKGYLMQFEADFYSYAEKIAMARLRAASRINHYQPDGPRFNKLLSALTHIYGEMREMQDGYQDVVRALLSILFIELNRG